MMSLRQKAAIVATVFFVSTMLQGCTPDPKECQGAEGKDMETCKQCVEKANKNSDASAKAVALKACAKVAKEASGAKKTDTTGATTEAPKNDANQGDSTTQNSESLQQVTENAVGNAAKASLAVASSVVQTSNPVELGANLLSTGPSVGSARARQKMAERVTNGASLDQDKSSRGVESQPVADAAQVTGGTNVAQERSSTREGQEGPLNIVEEFQQVANTAQASDSKNGAGASIEALHQSTDIQPQASDSKNSADAGIENLHQSTEIQPQASDSKNGAGASIEALHQSTEIQPQATDLKNSAGASIDTLHQSTETQPQATESKNGAAASIETLHQSTEIHPQVDGLLHSTRPVLANGLASHATEDPAEIKQTIEDPEAIAEVSSQPWPPSDERYKKGGKHDSLAQESLVDADDFYVHKQAATDTHKQEPFRAIVGTSGKVARVGKPRHDAQAKMQ